MNTTIEEASALSRHFFGMPAGSAKKGPEIIPVCTRPPDVDPKALEWLFTTETKGASYTTDAGLYARLRATARRVYVFDANAPAASVLRFAPPYDRLRCPGKPLLGDKSLNNPKSADKKAAFDALVAAVTAKASVSEFGGNGGSDKRTWTSAPDGSGANLSFFEAVVRQMVIAGAFQSGDIDGNLKDANGSRHGITSGKNVGGTDLLAVQLVAGTFLMLKTPLRTMGGFINKVASGLKRGGCLIIADVKLFPKKLAEQLVEKFGWSMAPSLHRAQTIMPYSRANMFTKGWEHFYQAHKILERAKWKKVFGQTNFEDLPAIILKKEEHEIITAKLKKSEEDWIDRQLKMKKRTEIKPEGLWEIYQDAYKDNPEWLRAIKHYFE